MAWIEPQSHAAIVAMRQEQMATCEALATLVREGWGNDTPAFRQVFTSLVFPGATQERVRGLNERHRLSTSPENAASLFPAFGDIDVSGVLQQITAPTLVTQPRRCIGVLQGLALARSIPDARFVPLESHNHILLPDEPAWPEFFAEISDVLCAEGRQSVLRPGKGTER